MTGKESGAYELKHRGKIHRASDLSQLLQWVKEYRVSREDSFRAAGTDEWLPVMSNPQFASLLNPDNQWTVSMDSGVFKAPDFDVIVQWARDGRVTEDAVIEGPRTPPGGVKASALPAVAPHLREVPGKGRAAPLLRIDNREYLAPDTDTIRCWIRESRVPVESEISLDGKNWEPVISSGLFDLEDWPAEAHGTVEEQELPDIPKPEEPPAPEPDERPEVTPEEEEEGPDHPDTETPAGTDIIPYTVVTADNEITVESVSELKRLLKRRVLFSYDEIKHPEITDESLSVGEFLDRLRTRGKKRALWIWGTLTVAISAVAALELTGVIEIIPWF